MRGIGIGIATVALTALAWCGCSLLTPKDLPPVDPDQLRSVADAEQRLALQLLARLRTTRPDANVLVGPDSILSAMTLAASGAAGETRAQLLGALGFDPTRDAPLEAVAALQRQVAAAADSVDLSVVHRLWIDASQHVTETWAQRVDGSFEHAFETVDFKYAPEDARDEINEFVADSTDDKITDVMPPGSIDSLTRLVITNATWFKGSWSHPFERDLTRPAPFTKQDRSTIDVPMMSMEATVGFAKTEDMVAVELPYEGDALSMLILVPRDIDSLDAWPADVFGRTVAQLRQQEVQVVLPRFSFRGAYALVDAFAELGVVDAFDRSRADFSPIDGTRGLFVAGIYHQTFVVVDEEGTEAAAATGATLAWKVAPMDPPVFRADRPFVFAIRHRASGAVLFAGVVLDPSKS
jgi:serpin B